MIIKVIISKQDPAGMNIHERLKELGFNDSILKEEKPLNLEDLDKEIEADLFIFPTIHQSKAAIPSLSVHVPGNWGQANKDFGGRPRQICLCPASYIREAYLTLNKLNNLENPKYEVVIEVTHHGPFLQKPILFIEIGSSDEQWKNKEAGMIIAKTILHLLEEQPKDYPVLFGIGGLHTAPILSHSIDKGYSLGHICPKYALENLDKEMVAQAMKRSIPKPTAALLDWKGMGDQKQRIIQLLNEMNIEMKRTDRI
jgi:D-aminoacyl-tRNA deacylase